MYKEYASKQFVEEYLNLNKSNWTENNEESSAHILNRPGGYVETNNKTVVTSTGVVLENYSLAFEDGYGEDLESFGIIPGMFEEEQYLVIWDDEEYICSSFEAGVAIHVGHNKYAEEGELGFDYMPFSISSGYGSSDIVAYSSFQTEETGITTHTFSLYKIEETSVKFDKKYLPENIVYFTEDEENGTNVPDEDNTLLAEIEALKAQIPLNIQFWWDYNMDAEVECGKNVSFDEIYSALENRQPIIAMLKIFNSAYDNNLENIEYWQLLISGIHNEFDDNDNIINTYIKFIDQTPSAGSYHLIYLDKNDVLSVSESNG